LSARASWARTLIDRLAQMRHDVEAPQPCSRHLTPPLSLDQGVYFSGEVQRPVKRFVRPSLFRDIHSSLNGDYLMRFCLLMTK